MEINTCKISPIFAESCLKNYTFFSGFHECAPPNEKILLFSRKWVQAWYTSVGSGCWVLGSGWRLGAE